ncbi:hypothetical protein [Sphingobium sp. Z007]|uniref:hypothetical protein n=1 Tax=Sphingobium sp. Z007 TaxID=627495 RepID=UPI000B49F05E|nr:hypothetical protein [Sphingobium sp. Z007]
MSHWRPRPAAHIGLRLIGLALLASLRLQAAWLHMLVRQSPSVTPLQLMVAASCFVSAAAGIALLLMGPDLWKPVRVASRWQG